MSDTGAGQRHADWFELFFDLVFVVTVSVLAHNLLSGVALTLIVLLPLSNVLPGWAVTALAAAVVLATSVTSRLLANRSPRSPRPAHPERSAA